MDILVLIGLILSIGFSVFLMNKNNKIIQEYERKISDLNDFREKSNKEAAGRALKASRNTLKGNISEIFCPFHNGFPYKAADCTFSGKPIDFIVFNNLEEYREGEKSIDDIEVVFVEVKSNLKASLSKVQSAIKKAVDDGRVRFETYKYDENTVKASQISLEAVEPNVKTLEMMDFSSLDKDENWSGSHKLKVMNARLSSPRAYRKWSPEEEDLLVAKVDEGYNLEELSILFGRDCSALSNRLANNLNIDVRDL